MAGAVHVDFRALASGTGALIARNPVIVGGTTAFLVTLFYVSANAMWYQPHAHKGTFFSTRDFEGYHAPALQQRAMPQAETRIRIEREPSPAHSAPPLGDPVVAKVQRILSGLKLYTGPVDGLTGPMTQSAVESYQRIVGLTVDGEITQALLDQLDGQPAKAAIVEPVPVPRTAPRSHEVAESHSSADTGVNGSETTASIPTVSEELKRVQAGLRAFGNDQIEIDGLMGAKTRSAILEFQSLFGLQQSGQADEELVLKMRQIGLIE